MDYINKSIGKYNITRKIGEGGMASVYEGIHEKLGTKVAIKILSPILARNPQLRQRFENEANFMASLNHPHITRVLDIEEQDETLAIVMELLEGEDLDDCVKRTGPISNAEVKVIFTQVLNAFDYAHSKGIIHRDIKPANIFIDRNNQVKILDFGIAKIFGTGNEMTQTGTQMGTPVYMSPEQVKGEKSIDHRSDIYALGITLYLMLTGKAPYESAEESSFEIFTKIVNEPIPHLSNNSFYDAIIQKAVSKDRNERYQTVNEMQKALDASSSKTKVESQKEVSQISSAKQNTPKLNSTMKLILAILSLVIIVSVFILYNKDQGIESNNPEETIEVSTTPTESTNTENSTSPYPGRYPEASERELEDKDFIDKSRVELRIMRNEIFARYGYIFKSEDLRAYFNNQDWYSPRFENVNDMLTDLEKRNADFIKSHE
jgi:serine/threonine protein kinase